MNSKRSRISLNCSLTAPPTTQDGCHTPNTPEILNTIVNITSQLEQYQVSNLTIIHPPSLHSPSHSDISSSSSSCSPMTPTMISQETCSTVQDFHSQFIKEGLKMKVKQKLKNEPQDSERFMTIKREYETTMNRKRSRISLNCSLTAPPTIQDGCHTPNTPEILNTIVNITSQLEPHQLSNLNIIQPPSLHSPSHSDISSSSSCSPMTPTQISPQESCSTVQEFQSQFIKEGLKMKVKHKLKNEPQDFERFMTIKKEYEDSTPEDNVRRQKRRERNKIAAEKCRIKKKKETMNLFSESEVVEHQNACYKDDIARLEAEQRHLMNILAQHQPLCKKQPKSDTSSQANPCSWNFDGSNTFRVPTVPPSRHHKSGAVESPLKIESGEVFVPGDARDYSEKHIDWKMNSDENVAPSYSSQRSSNNGQEEGKYSSLSCPGYSLGHGYYGGLVAM